MATNKFQPGSASFQAKKPEPISQPTIQLPTQECSTPYSTQARQIRYHLGSDSGSYRELTGQFLPPLSQKELTLAWEQIRNVCHCSTSASQMFLTSFYHLEESHFSVTTASTMQPLRSFFVNGTLSDTISYQDAWSIIQSLVALLNSYYSQDTTPATHLGCMTLDHILYDPQEKQIRVIPAAPGFHLDASQPGFPPEMATATDHARVDIFMVCYVAVCLLKKTTQVEHFAVSEDRKMFQDGLNQFPNLRPTLEVLSEALQIEPPSKTRKPPKKPAPDLSELAKKLQESGWIKKIPVLQELLEDWKAEPQIDKTGTL